MQSDQPIVESGDFLDQLSWGFVRRNIVRGFKFAVAGGTGFLIAEGLIFMGLVLVGDNYLLQINAVAAILSIAGGFFINEHWTSRNEGDHGGSVGGMLFRLFKFELVYGLGNIISIAVQLFLFYYFSVYPLIGNIAGAVAALPANYFVSMVVVWRIKL